MTLIKVQMRFDGTLGFPGGIADKGETPEMAVNREMSEELGCSVDDFAVTLADHLLNQARAGRRPARTWFLRIASVRELLYACLCVRPRSYQ